ncbi:hypothetical protein SLA_2008 [Streptomyces laurentii]|uniref:Uncharacterized protein n=1 Tax=Streptomyces laurentii TaxID=39478 RepID=A0A160NXY6_STRLU|nr:hypothetical protein SLA_2008 [Streptomyces laurentii]
MAKVRAHVVHDVTTGRITSIGRVSKGAKAVKMAGEGQTVLKTKIKEGRIQKLVSGGGRVDAQQVVASRGKSKK